MSPSDEVVSVAQGPIFWWALTSSFFSAVTGFGLNLATAHMRGFFFTLFFRVSFHAKFVAQNLANKLLARCEEEVLRLGLPRRLEGNDCGANTVPQVKVSPLLFMFNRGNDFLGNKNEVNSFSELKPSTHRAIRKDSSNS